MRAEQEPAHALARELVECGGGSVRAIVLYGSHLSRANPDPNSAIDLVVIVNSYGGFYRALAHAGELRRWTWLMRLFSHVLPPNVTAFGPEHLRPSLAKCLVLSLPHFKRAMGDRPRDHFVLCRMVQWVEVIYAASPGDRLLVDEALAQARLRTVEWVMPYLSGPVDSLSFAGTMLEVSYRGEVRPEKRDRARVLVDAQAAFLRTAYQEVLEVAADGGLMVESPEGYRVPGPVSPALVRRWRRRFRMSRLRVSARWAKHIITFDNWLPYLVRKAERHSGVPIELTRLERKWPLLFMWPKAISFVRAQSKGRTAATSQHGAEPHEEAST